eukprot:11202534-Lingulodinium_polyedra.AAC.1
MCGAAIYAESTNFARTACRRCQNSRRIGTRVRTRCDARMRIRAPGRVWHDLSEMPAAAGAA